MFVCSKDPITLVEALDRLRGRDNIDPRPIDTVLEHTVNPLQIVAAWIDHLKLIRVLFIEFLQDPGVEKLRAAIDQRQEAIRLLDEGLITVKGREDQGALHGL